MLGEPKLAAALLEKVVADFGALYANIPRVERRMEGE
jgi:hypothetical protein